MLLWLFSKRFYIFVAGCLLFLSLVLVSHVLLIQSFFLNLLKLVNEEMFWVITEICSEQNIDNRMKIIQCFLKVASKYVSDND